MRCFSLHTRWLKSVADLVASRTSTIVAGGGHKARLQERLPSCSRPISVSLHHGAFPCSQSEILEAGGAGSEKKK